MSKLTSLINKTITSLTAAELMGIKTIQENICSHITSLKKIQIPPSVEVIGSGAFQNCSISGMEIEFIAPCSLIEIKENAFINFGNTNMTIKGLDNISPYCILRRGTIESMYWISNKRYSGSIFYISNGQTMIDSNGLTGNFTIPDVIQLGPYSCSGDDTTTTSLVIPDTVEIIGYSVFASRTGITNITIGSSVRYIDSLLYPQSNSATLIFRQPAGMHVELPTPGAHGLAYNKTSRAITVYTDNECIRNYDWATDNATVTFYPLADAPT